MDLTWDTFAESFVAPALPAVHNVGGEPRIRLFVDSGARRIGLWLVMGGCRDAIPGGGRALTIRIVEMDGAAVLEVATSVEQVYKQFFDLAVEIAARVQRGEIPQAAVADSLDAWRALVSGQGRLTEEGEIGLWGELWMLRWLAGAGFDRAIEAWIGPHGEPHDFRFGRTELEIKSTTTVLRRHHIGSLDQLEPTAGFSLFLISIAVARAAGAEGEVVSELVKGCRAILGPSADREFNGKLEALGCAPDDLTAYRTRLILRCAPMVVPVDAACPRLTREGIRRAVVGEQLSRIMGLRYVLDVEGIGSPLLSLQSLTP